MTKVSAAVKVAAVSLNGNEEGAGISKRRSHCDAPMSKTNEGGAAWHFSKWNQNENQAGILDFLFQTDPGRNF